MPQEDPQGRLPFEVAEAHHRENIALLRRLRLPGKARDFLVWVANNEFKWGSPLRVTYRQIGETERGLACSRATAARVVDRLRNLGVLSVENIVTPNGQRPNEYRVNWVEVSRLWSEVTGDPTSDRQPPSPEFVSPKPESHFDNARVSKCARPSLILTTPESHFDTHNKEQHVLKTHEEIPPYRDARRRSGEKRGFGSAPAREDFLLLESEWPTVREKANQIIQALGRPKPGKEQDDRELAFKIAWLSHLGQLPESVTADAIAVIKSGFLKGERIRNNAAMYRGILVMRCDQLEIDLHRLLSRTPGPEWLETISQSQTMEKV
jgi:hypothetical protein